MTNALQLGFQRFDNTLVFVTHHSMVTDQLQDELNIVAAPQVTTIESQMKSLFGNHGFFMMTYVPDRQVWLNEVMPSYVPNSPAANTAHLIQDDDLIAILHADMLGNVRYKSIPVLMTAMKLCREYFIDTLRFRHSEKVIYTHEQARTNLWQAVAKIHGGKATWDAFMNLERCNAIYALGDGSFKSEFNINVQVAKNAALNPIFIELKKAMMEAGK